MDPKTHRVPAALRDQYESDFDALEGKVLRFPERNDINAPVNEQLIVELYSR